MIRLKQKKNIGWLCVMVGSGLLLGVLGTSAFAATLTLKIRAINPSQSDKQSVDVKQPLPKLVKPDDVVSAGELDVVYDVTSKGYFVQKKVEVDPGQTRTFDVVIKDIWIIPDETLRDMADQIRSLSSSLKGSEQEATSEKLAGMIQENIESVSARQAAYAVGQMNGVQNLGQSVALG